MLDKRMMRTLSGMGGVLVLAFVLAGCGDQQKAVADKEQPKDQGATATEDKLTPAGEEQASEQAPSKAGPTSRTYTLAAGTSFTGTLQQTLDSGKNHVGDPFSIRTVLAKTVDGATAVPAGSTIRGHLSYVDGAGRVAGGAKLTLRYDSIKLPDGTTYDISAAPLRLEGKGDAKESALEIGGGAVAGGILGGVLGHGSGDVAKGAAVGAVVGTGVAVATKGDQIVLGTGQKINVVLDAPLKVTRTGS
ncbi:MAG TPA: hypothetical protein VFX78_09285 [Candidatus Eisenbacteria bacterium]|nr:hypothetical protein [Candidatus Eisenbacteria bacterium]